jgi:hypothetical protein
VLALALRAVALDRPLALPLVFALEQGAVAEVLFPLELLQG